MTDMKVWRKGDKAPDKGVPYRHTRDKAMLLLESATPDQVYAVLRTLIETDARAVLPVLAQVIEQDEEARHGT